MYYAYILKCEDNSYYTGYSNDPQKRFEKHKSGKGAKYTRAHKPVSLELVINADTKSEALRIENSIKKMSHAEKEQLIEFNRAITMMGVLNAKYTKYAKM